MWIHCSTTHCISLWFAYEYDIECLHYLHSEWWVLIISCLVALFKFGFSFYKAEQPLQRIKPQEKEEYKEYKCIMRLGNDFDWSSLLEYQC